MPTFHGWPSLHAQWAMRDDAVGRVVAEASTRRRRAAAATARPSRRARGRRCRNAPEPGLQLARRAGQGAFGLELAAGGPLLLVPQLGERIAASVGVRTASAARRPRSGGRAAAPGPLDGDRLGGAGESRLDATVDRVRRRPASTSRLERQRSAPRRLPSDAIGSRPAARTRIAGRQVRVAPSAGRRRRRRPTPARRRSACTSSGRRRGGRTGGGTAAACRAASARCGRCASPARR